MTLFSYYATLADPEGIKGSLKLKDKIVKKKKKKERKAGEWLHAGLSTTAIEIQRREWS